MTGKARMTSGRRKARPWCLALGAIGLLAGLPGCGNGSGSSAQRATQLRISNVAPGQVVARDEPFAVTVERLDARDLPVSEARKVDLRLSGPGLAGNTTGTIELGRAEVTISGVRFDTIGTKTLTASAPGLSEATVTITVHEPAVWGSFVWGSDRWTRK